MTVAQMKKWIDQSSYEGLLSKWRFAPVGDPFFTTPEVAAYYQQRMAEKREAVGDGGHVAASKSIGWKW